jgi:hypothetical protein
MSTRPAGVEVLAQLCCAGMYGYIDPDSLVVHETKVKGVMDVVALHAFRKHRSFQEGIWHLLHDVGEHPTEFRSYRGAFVPDQSLQVVIDMETGVFEADVDRYNTQDVVNIVGHLVVEVVLPKVRRLWRRLRRKES